MNNQEKLTDEQVAQIEGLMEELSPVIDNMVITTSSAAKMRGLEEEDVRQAAYLAICKAVQRFEEGKGLLVPYVKTYIWGDVKHLLRDTAPFKVSRHVNEALQKVLKLQGNGKTKEEIMTELDITEETYTQCMVLYEESAVRSVHFQSGEEEGETSTSVESLLGKEEDFSTTVLQEASKKLTQRQKKIFRGILEGYSQQEVAADVGVSQMTVSRELSMIRDKVKRVLIVQ
jgi:RNA polymerase sigma-B factor